MLGRTALNAAANFKPRGGEKGWCKMVADGGVKAVLSWVGAPKIFWSFLILLSCVSVCETGCLSVSYFNLDSLTPFHCM